MADALLLVDIQMDYFEGGRMEVPGALASARNAGLLLRRHREREEPLVHVSHLSTRPGATFFLPGTEGIGVHPEVAPLPGEMLVEKNLPNSFHGTGLDALLRGRGVERLIVCGMMTQMCIDTTVRAAFDLGYRVLLAHDATAARALSFNGVAVSAAQVQAAYLAALGAVFAKIASTEEILREGDR